MSSKFTAEEARKLAGKTVEEKVDSLLVAIKDAATNKKRKLRTSWEYEEDNDLWVNGGYNKTKEWIEACKILEALGYKVSFYYNEGSIAVDMYTLISW